MGEEKRQEEAPEKRKSIVWKNLRKLLKKSFQKRSDRTKKDEQLVWALQTRAWIVFAYYSIFRLLSVMSDSVPTSFDDACDDPII